MFARAPAATRPAGPEQHAAGEPENGRNEMKILGVLDDDADRLAAATAATAAAAATGGPSGDQDDSDGFWRMRAGRCAPGAAKLHLGLLHFEYD